MPQVFIATGPSQGFNVELDRIPVSGDLVNYQNQNYPIEAVLLMDGGGTQCGAGIPRQAESVEDTGGLVSEPMTG
ncbi:MAG TPA: hypothetical protein VIT45_02940 [Allosphingosinicella sp.]